MNPYHILGVSPNSSKEEIIEAYKNIVEKYNSIQPQDIEEQNLVEDAIEQANLAYDTLINGNIYREIRSLIDNDNIALAESKLNILDLKESAEWNYLKGFVFLKKGWFDVGIQHIITAKEIEPENEEYTKTVETLKLRAKDIVNFYKQQQMQNNRNINNMGNINNLNPCGNNSNMMGGGMC
ncbi:J domain-containing protein [Clostridium isatidis]|uniref:ABC transporter substrate-binding protein n=1 Tax=Clostridium isatidis TaxID=182773 RepID=A0A343JBZ0_9CLOT|nr:J domain-containing protein [Clostridium isatidis]ASW43048.1 ABC transporter substrate-binding protein [Clostridium isatidis]NLZ33698.1 J domain-containing protein [Clostridiales bacterium]